MDDWIEFVITSTCKGGGYWYCRTSPPHPKANSKGLYPLHRVLAENKLRRHLLPGEDVHHEDEVKSNNDPDNLVVLSKSAHGKLHARTVEPQEIDCYVCGRKFPVKPHVMRARLGRVKSGILFCSRSCGTKHQWASKGPARK